MLELSRGDFVSITVLGHQGDAGQAFQPDAGSTSQPGKADLPPQPVLLKKLDLAATRPLPNDAGARVSLEDGGWRIELKDLSENAIFPVPLLPVGVRWLQETKPATAEVVVNAIQELTQIELTLDVDINEAIDQIETLKLQK